MPATEADHVAYYSGNENYAQFLSELPVGVYQKYLDHLSLSMPARILDVGCGAGQVVHALVVRGHDAYGVDACAPALDIARQGPGSYHLLTDYHLPFDASTFDAVGCYTVLEHVAAPEGMLAEMARVLRPGGRIVVACPNFLRVAGISAHHWHTRGMARKGSNLAALTRKVITARLAPERMCFDHMTPVTANVPFQPDDDAIVVTNPIDVGFFLRRHGIRITYHSGVLVPMRPLYERLAELPVVRTVIGGVFAVGVKRW